MSEESVIIELDTILEYRNGLVCIKKMNTNEMSAILTYRLIEALNKTIVEYHKKTRNETSKSKNRDNSRNHVG